MVIWGGRKNNCFSDGTFRLLSERITRAMAEHFASVPQVIGWQTDNEFGGTDCRCPRCRSSFQDWLRSRYATLEELNRAWGTHFWGLKLQAWDEIQIPDSRTGAWAISNPSSSLDWQRFTSWLNVRFQGDQVRILRAQCPGHFVTHNFMGLFQDGVKDGTNVAHARTLPGLLAPALGIEIEEYEALAAVEYALVANAPLEGRFTATRYADWIVPKGSQVVAAFADWQARAPDRARNRRLARVGGPRSGGRAALGCLVPEAESDRARILAAAVLHADP